MSDSRHPLEDVLGHRFSDPALLQLALTHRGAPSIGRDKDALVANERLEFLGDRVLGLTIAQGLFGMFPNENEGALAARLARLVSASELARVAGEIGLASHVKTARAQTTNPKETAVLADACEAVIGALYLDGGLEAARTFVHRFWTATMQADTAPPKDPKMGLQEWAQGRGLPLPHYREIEVAGPAHAPTFVMGVSVAGYPEVSARGRTKRLAGQAAAAALLAHLLETTL